jgi:hypothetical protein
MREYKGKPAADAAGFSDSAAGTSVHAVCQPGFFFTGLQKKGRSCKIHMEIRGQTEKDGEQTCM